MPKTKAVEWQGNAETRVVPPPLATGTQSAASRVPGAPNSQDPRIPSFQGQAATQLGVLEPPPGQDHYLERGIQAALGRNAQIPWGVILLWERN